MKPNQEMVAPRDADAGIACPVLVPCLDPKRRLVGDVCGLCRVAQGRTRLTRLPKGARLPPFPADAGAEWAFRVVRSGAVSACLSTRDGRRQISELFLAGELIASLGGDDGAGGWLEALGRVELWDVAVPSSDRGQTPDAADPDARRLAAILSRAYRDRLVRARRHAAILGRLDGAERLDAFLLDLVERIGVAGPDGWMLSLPLGREDMADHLGLKSETVSRLIKRGIADGYLHRDTPRRLVVTDLAGLRARVPL